MNALIISNDVEHQAYLREASGLMSSESGTPDGARLELLATAIEAYESKRFPFEKPTKNEALAFRLQNSGVDKKILVPIFSSIEEVEKVISGLKDISEAEFAASLAAIESGQTVRD